MKRCNLVMLLLVLFVSACARPTGTPTPSDNVTLTPMPPAINGQAVADQVRSQIATDLGVPTESLTLVGSIHEDWPDTSLGCPQPDHMYAQMIVPGWRFTFSDEAGTLYEVHTDESGSQYVLCRGTSDGLEPASPAELRGRQAVAEHFNVSEAEVRLLSSEAVDWSDSCLGCAAPGVMCLMVITPGYRLVYQVGDQKVEVHTNQDGSAVTLCNVGGVPAESENPLTGPAFAHARQFVMDEFPGYGLGQLALETWQARDVTPAGLLGGVRYRYESDLWAFEVQCPVVERPLCDVSLLHRQAGQVWRGVVETDGTVRTGDGRPALTFKVTPCDQNAGVPASGGSLQADVKDGQLLVTQTIAYVCCADIQVSLGWDGETRTLKLIESNAGEVCRCMCAYPMQAVIGPLPAGTYRLEAWGVQKLDAGHPLDLLHSLEVQVP